MIILYCASAINPYIINMIHYLSYIQQESLFHVVEHPDYTTMGSTFHQCIVMVTHWGGDVKLNGQCIIILVTELTHVLMTISPHIYTAFTKLTSR